MYSASLIAALLRRTSPYFGLPDALIDAPGGQRRGGRAGHGWRRFYGGSRLEYSASPDSGSFTSSPQLLMPRSVWPCNRIPSRNPFTLKKLAHHRHPIIHVPLRQPEPITVLFRWPLTASALASKRICRRSPTASPDPARKSAWITHRQAQGAKPRRRSALRHRAHPQ